MAVLKKLWWVFGILAIVAGIFNAYAAITMLAVLMIMAVNSVFVLLGKAGRAYQNSTGLPGLLIRLQSLAFWFWAGVDIFSVVMLVYVLIQQTFGPGAAPVFAWFTLPYEAEAVALASLVAASVLYLICMVLLVMRLYEIFWKDRYG